MSESPDDASRWSWVTPDGKTVTGAKGELMLALRSEKLPATTLVWRSGWAEWLPASRVTELKSVLPPGKAEPAQAPKLAPGIAPPKAAQPAPLTSRPPPAPVRGAKGQSNPPPAPNRARVATQPQTSQSRSKEELPRPHLAGPRVPTAAGPVAVAAAAQAPTRGVSILGPPREQHSAVTTRAPMPTLGGEEDASLRSLTLRPPGAVPPPPRAGGGPSLGQMPRVEDELPTQRHLPIPSATVPDIEMAPPTELRAGVILPTRAALSAQPGMSGDFDATLGSTPFESSSGRAAPPTSLSLEGDALSELPAGAALSGTAEARAGLSFTLPVPLSVAICLGVFIAGFLFVVAGALVYTPQHTQAAAEASASAPAEAAPPPGCALIAPAARLNVTVERAVQPSLAELTPGERILVGFAATPKVASGLSIHLDNLDAEKAFEQKGDSPVRSSAPRLVGGAPKFSVDRADSELTGARTLADGSTLGFAGTELVRTNGGKKTVLFAGAAGEKTTDPRAATGGAGTLVTFRRGGLSGQVFYGWLDANGAPNGKLVAVETGGIKFLGTPDAAANRAGGVVAFAGRPNDTADWRVQLAAVAPSGTASAKGFEPPPGGSGGGNIAPALTAFGEDGWVLQWTEGASGAYEVRMQRLGAKLEPLGDARLVSPKGANAGQGAIVASGARVLSVFIQTTAGHDELWGASFECH